MPVIKLSQVIDRPADDVFRVLADVSNLAAWNPTIKSARKLSDGPAGEGTRFEMEIDGFGAVPHTLEEFRPNEQARYVPHFKVTSGGHRFRLTAQGQKTTVEHELEMSPKGWYVLMSPLMGMMGRKNLRRTADALKQYVEAKPASSGS
jgi:uncharacterized protein YndB with AHSA1/START domain